LGRLTDIQRQWLITNMARDLKQTLKHSGYDKKGTKEFGLDDDEYEAFKKKIKRQLREQPDESKGVVNGRSG
jgi:hypothetical protein